MSVSKIMYLLHNQQIVTKTINTYCNLYVHCRITCIIKLSLRQIIANRKRKDCWSELYFVNNQDQTDIRKAKLQTQILRGRYTNEEITILSTIIDELGEYFNTYNGLIRKFKQGREKMDEMEKKGKFREFHMLFNADARPKGKHPGRYNSPALSEVGIIFNDEHPDVVHHDVVVYFRDKPEYRKDGKEDATQTFDSENAFYDPLRKSTHGHPKSCVFMFPDM